MKRPALGTNFFLMILIYRYRKVFPLPEFKLTLLAVIVILICSSILGLLFQLVIEQFCATRVVVILFGGLLFWAVVGPLIFNLGRSCFLPTNKRFWIKTIGAAFAVAAMNQIFLSFLLSFFMRVLYGCIDLGNNWLQNILANNIVVNFLCFGSFFCAGALVSLKSEKYEKTKKVLPDKIFSKELRVKNGSILTLIPMENVYWIQADNKCVTIVGDKFKHVVYQSLKSMESELDPACFIRIHRGTIINKIWLMRLHSLPTGDAFAEMKNGVKLRVSRSFRGKGL